MKLSPLGRVLLLILLTALLLAVLMWFTERGPRCPDGEVPVLSDTQWVCVRRGNS